MASEPPKGSPTPLDTPAADTELVAVEVRLISSSVIAKPTLPRSTPVSGLLELVLQALGPEACGYEAQLLLDAVALDSPETTLAAAGVENGASLTLVLQKRRLWAEPVLGTNARVERDEIEHRTVVRRAKEECDGAVVVSRHIARRFSLKVLDNSASWSGSVEMGFTSKHPDELTLGLPSDVHGLFPVWVMHNAGGIRVSDQEVSKLMEAAPNWTEGLEPGDILTVAIERGNAEIGAIAGESDNAQSARWNGEAHANSPQCEDSTEAGGTSVSSGRFVVELNDEVKVVAGIQDVHSDIQLYPIVSLYAKMIAVELPDSEAQLEYG